MSGARAPSTRWMRFAAIAVAVALAAFGPQADAATPPLPGKLASSYRLHRTTVDDLNRAARSWYEAEARQERSADEAALLGLAPAQAALMGDLVDGLGHWIRSEIVDERAHRAEIAALALAAEGVRHPLVPLILAMAMREDGIDRSWLALMEEAVAGLGARGAPPELRLVASSVATYAARPLYRAHVHRRFDEVHVVAYLELVRRHGADARAGGELDHLHMLDEAGFAIVANWPPDLVERLLDEVAAMDHVDHTLRLVLRGAHANRRAWDSRGTAFAAEVADAQWQGFRTGLEEASGHLRVAWELDPRRPTAASIMIRVALGLGLGDEDDPERWFERAIAAQPDAFDAWHARMWSLQPRWRGSLEAMHRQLRRVFEIDGIDHSQASLLATAVQSIAEASGGIAWLDDAEVLALIERARKRFVGRDLPNHLRRTTTLAILAATEGGDHAHAAELLKSLPSADRHEHTLDWGVLGPLRVDPRGLRHDILALGGPYAMVVRTAEDHVARGRHAEAIKLLSALLVEAESTGMALELVAALRDRIVTAETAHAYASGEWVTLPVEAGLPGWRVHDGVWRADGDALLGNAVARPARIVSTLRPGPRFEVRATLLVHGSTEWTSVAILADYADRPGLTSHGAPRFRAASWLPRQGRAELLPRPIAGQDAHLVEIAAALPERAASLHMLVHDEVWGLLLDGRVAARGPTAASCDGSGFIAFGTRDRLPVRAGPVRIAEISIRRLDELPAALREARADAIFTAPGVTDTGDERPESDGQESQP